MHRRSRIFALVGLPIVVVAVVLVALSVDPTDPNPKGTYALIFGIVGAYVFLLLAIQRLRIELALAVRCEHLEPSALWRTRLAGTRLSVSVEHPDFPALLAEALDALESCQWRLDEASQRQGCSSSQLVKLLKLEHRALGQLNAARRELGLRELK